MGEKSANSLHSSEYQFSSAMLRFKLMFVFFAAGAVLLIAAAILLLVAFSLNTLHLETGLKQAANFDRWGIFGVLAALVSAALAVLFGYVASVLYQFLRCEKNTIVGELMYILGIEEEVMSASRLCIFVLFQTLPWFNTRVVVFFFFRLCIPVKRYDIYCKY